MSTFCKKDVHGTAIFDFRWQRLSNSPRYIIEDQTIMRLPNSQVLLLLAACFLFVTCKDDGVTPEFPKGQTTVQSTVIVKVTAIGTKVVIGIFR